MEQVVASLCPRSRVLDTNSQEIITHHTSYADEELQLINGECRGNDSAGIVKDI